MTSIRFSHFCFGVIAFGCVILCCLATAQLPNFLESDFRAVYGAVDAKGDSVTVSARGAAKLGFQAADDIRCREVNINVQNGRHGIDSCSYANQEFLMLNRHDGADKWDFMIDHSGKLTVAFHGLTGHGLQPLDLAEAQPLAAAEEAYWTQWLRDGAKVPSSGSN